MWNKDQFLKRKRPSWKSVLFHIVIWGTYALVIFKDLTEYFTEWTFYYGILLFWSLVLLSNYINIGKPIGKVIKINAHDKWYDMSNVFSDIFPFIGIYYLGTHATEDSWIILQHWPYLMLGFILLLVYKFYTNKEVVERSIKVEEGNLYFEEAKSTYYAPIVEFDKIRISYNKISAIAKDGRKDRLGGYIMTDGAILNLVAFLKENAPNVELDVLFEDTKD